MLMKKSALTEMQTTLLVDREGNDVEMQVKAKSFNGRIYLFMSDTHLLGASNLAKDAIYYIQQLRDRFQLDSDTEFYRHIFQESMGSLFGRFIVNWDNETDPSYRFQMLTNVDDMVGVNKVIAEGGDVALTMPQSRSAAV